MRYHKSKCIIANTIGGTVVFLLSAAWIGCITHYRLPYYLADSVTVSVGNESALTPSAAPPHHRLVFRKPGDSYVVPKHEPIEIIYDNVDIANGMLVVISREADNSVIIRFQGRYDPVQLSSKCETVILQGVDVLPPIEAINNAALKQQIIITPLVSDDCRSMLGYEVRYGSIQQGCTETAHRVEKLSKCREQQAGVVRRNVYSIRSLRQLLFNL